MQVVKYQFQQLGDERGQLVALEEFKDIPFEIKRVFFMYGTDKGVRRGNHAHRTLEQILICIHGSCKISLDNGLEKKKYFWKSHMKDYIFQAIYGERCMIFLQMQCFCALLQNCIMKRNTLEIIMSF